MERKTIDLDQGWDYMQKGITKLKRILEGLQESPFSSEEYMMLYTTIYNMCTQKPPHDYSQQLYDKYKQAFEEYISSTVLPSLSEKHDEYMLRELVRRWANHKVMVRWLSRFFHYLDRYFIARRSLPALNEVGLTCFREQVYDALNNKAKDAIIALIDKEREGEQIDRALLKNVLDIFVEIGMGQMDSYEKDFEEHMLQDTGAYYSRKATNWILEDSCPQYMIKAEECLKKERDRVSHYLHSSSEPKLVEKVQHELLVVYATQLLEKEQSGCRALLREDKVEDLSRIYRLYHKIPKGLEPLSDVFKQHITAEGTVLVQQAEDATTNQGGSAGAVQEQVLIRKIIELHDKYMEYVTNCFVNHTLFHKVFASVGGTFELGFFSPGTSAKRYLGIWYKKVIPRTVAWVANRENPLTDHSGMLNVTIKGTVLLLDGRDRIIWSSNTSKPMGRPVLNLLDSGNLVVKDDNLDNPLWQSFDHPCDTLLPGMKLGRNFKTGTDRYLSSWKSKDDPAPGQFSLWIDPHGFPQLVLRKGSAMHYRAGSWNGLGFTGTPPLKDNVPVCNYQFVLNENEVYYECDSRGALVSRLWVNQSGLVLRSIRALSQPDGWLHAYHAPVDQCDLYSLCGANARCITESNPVCACLEGFVPKSPKDWSMSNWSEGCVRERELKCEKGDEFPNYARLKLPDTSTSWFNKSMTLSECAETCSRNCSCTAYANSDIRNGSGCLLWFGDLADMKGYSDAGQDLYIRMATSKKGQSVTKKNVAIIITCGFAMAIFILALILYIRKKKLKKQGLQMFNHIKNYNNGGGKEDMELWEFDFASVAKATGNFSSDSKLGEGGFGPVYKGTLVEGQEIAVKKLSKSSGQGMEEFKNEVTLIAKLQHRNLVKLLGCCIQADETMLIYEYMPNKSLDFFIFDQVRSRYLDWQKRIHIVGGIARGMLYLHQDSRMRIIHRDLKASNVLLDNDMNPKISDFGMARIFGGDEIQTNTNKVVGTYGYMSPEYAAEGIFSVKSDVFSFGVLVLEIVSGKKNWRFSHPDHEHNLLGHAWIRWKERRAMELAGNTLDEFSPPPDEVLRCIHVGLLCVQQRPEDRPNMSSVVLMLGSEGSLPEPKQPGFFTEMTLPEADFPSSNTQSCTTNELTITQLQGR